MSKPFGKYSDAELVIAIKRSEQEAEAAFAELYSRYSQRTYAYCIRVTGNVEDANDIFQEAFLKFYDSIHRTDEVKNPGAFLLMITRNICLNFRRDKKKTVTIEDYQLHTHDKSYEQKELLDLIAHALECLNFDQKEAFVLRQYHGMSYKEIAEIVGETASTIRNRVWRAKERIKEVLSPYLEDIVNNK